MPPSPMDSREDAAHEATQPPPENPYRTVFEGLPEPALLLCPANGRIVMANDAAAELFGYDPSAMEGRSVDTVGADAGPASTDELETLLTELDPGETRSIRRQVTDDEGQLFWAEISLSGVVVRDQTHAVWLVRSLDEQIERERDRLTFETAVANAGHAIYWTDTNGRIEYANPAVEEITGYDREFLIGKTPRIFKSGEMSAEYYEELWETILDGETFREEVINETADGERLVLSQTVAPITGPSGTIERFVAVNSDITDRKRREERLEAEKEAVEQLQERLSVMNRILRHDIRSSVNIIRGNAELAAASERRLDQALETIVEESDRLQRIGESVRHIQSVLEEDESPDNVLDVATLLQAKVHRFQNDYPCATFDLDLPQTAVVQAREQFGLAIDHLLANAIEHNDRNRPTVTVAVETTAETVRIEVRDDGPGIPDAEIQPLSDGRETPLEHTSGLGLWLAHWIVAASDGRLSFEENEPRGTVVRIELPRAR